MGSFLLKRLLYFGPFFVWFLCGVIFIESNLVEQVPREPHTVCRGATCPIFSELHWHVFARKKWYMAHLFLLSQNNFFLNQAASSILSKIPWHDFEYDISSPFFPFFHAICPIFFQRTMLFSWQNLLHVSCFPNYQGIFLKMMFWGKISMKTTFINQYSLYWVSVFCAPFWHIKANHWYGKPSSIDSITDVRPSSKKKGHNNIPHLSLYHDLMPHIVESKLKFVLSIKDWSFFCLLNRRKGGSNSLLYLCSL